MVPEKTFEKLGAHNIAPITTRDPYACFVMTGVDHNDLAVLALRLNSAMTDANELRDWQNRINLMLSGAEELP